MMLVSVLISRAEKNDPVYAAASKKIKGHMASCLKDPQVATQLATRLDRLVSDLWPEEAAKRVLERASVPRYLPPCGPFDW